MSTPIEEKVEEMSQSPHLDERVKFSVKTGIFNEIELAIKAGIQRLNTGNMSVVAMPPQGSGGGLTALELWALTKIAAIHETKAKAVFSEAVKEIESQVRQAMDSIKKQMRDDFKEKTRSDNVCQCGCELN